MEEEEFKTIIKKAKGPHNHKVKNSLGVYDAYKYYRKIRPKFKEYVLTESMPFMKIKNLAILQ